MTSYKVFISHTGHSAYRTIVGYLESEGYQVDQCVGTDGIENHSGAQQCDIWIADEASRWSGDRTLIQYLHHGRLEKPLIIMSEYGSIHNAVEAVKLGASDYLTLTTGTEVLAASLKKALAQRCTTPRSDRTPESRPARPLIGQSEEIRQLLSIARRIASSDATVLIQGESGSGKELLARYIHAHGDRCQQPFVAMNCAALPENLAESELFGFRRGAFTGAQKNRQGKFVQADTGTLLLDEVSEMQPSLQAKLLRVLQEKEVDPIGGSTPIPVDVRCIASTNRDLSQMIESGTFREDLYYRLRVIPLIIPPLRERPEDIAVLVDYFIQKYHPRDRHPTPRFSREAMDRMRQWPWPGNVRELENTVQRALLLCNQPVVDAQALMLEPDRAGAGRKTTHKLVGMTVKDMERTLIGQTLHHVNQNRTHAAKMLGISIRTLRNKLREYEQRETFADRAQAGK